MFLTERYRRNPPQRPSTSAADPLPADDSPSEPDAWDEADELAAISHDDFLRQLRAEDRKSVV